MTSEQRYEDPDGILRIDIAVPAPDGTVRLHVRGDLDRDTAHHLTSATGHTLATAGVVRMELSLAEVAFIDAAGARCLLQCQRAAEAAGVTMTSRDPSPRVVRVMDGPHTRSAARPAGRSGRGDARRRRA